MAGSVSFVLIFNLTFLIYQFHPLHVSVTEIEMDEKDKRLEIMMRVFIDDFESTLRQNRNTPELDILALDTQGRDALVSNYLKEHFKISLDSKAYKTNFLGHEIEEDAFIFYIEVPNVKKWNTIQIQNRIIMDTYSDQSNLVHVSVKNKVRSLRLTKDNPVDTLTFDF